MTRLFHNFLVRWVQQLHWPSSSLTHVKDSFTQAVLPKSFFLIRRYGKTEHFPKLKVHHIHLATLPLSILLEEQALARFQCLARAFLKQSRSHQSPVLKSVRQWPQWENHSLRVSNLAKDQINEECLFGKSLGCWCFRVTTHCGWGSGLWQEWAEHAALAWFHNRSKALSRVSDLKLQVFKRHFCYQRVNGRCWAQVVGGCSSSLAAVAAPRKVSSIFVTSSEWWYILNEIKEAYRMERYFSDHVAYRLDRHSSAKPSACWDLFAAWISPEKAVLGGRFMQVEVCLSRFRMVFWNILNRFRLFWICFFIASYCFDPNCPLHGS